ncbi:MAG: hypothetical protein K8R76_10860 [Candidatus Aegiribacteria sp.]|nr:hypothetical protein [Candidatus Aegiribacteria sp.]
MTVILSSTGLSDVGEDELISDSPGENFHEIIPESLETDVQHSDIILIVNKNPTGALLRSAALPGWGQFYNDKPIKGLLFGSVELGLLSWLIIEHLASEDARHSGDEHAYEAHSQRRLDLIWYTSAAWLFGMLDAYVDAYLYSFESENEEFEKETGIGAAVFFRF